MGYCCSSVLQPHMLFQATADDEIAVHALTQIALETGVSKELFDSNFREMTLEWIARARIVDRYQGFVAEVDDQVIGFVGCQRYQKGYPRIIKPSVLRYGYIWGLYVEPTYRRQGIATRLMQTAIEYLSSIDCTQILLHASQAGQPMYEQLGFQISNEMSLKIDEIRLI